MSFIQNKLHTLLAKTVRVLSWIFSDGELFEPTHASRLEYINFVSHAAGSWLKISAADSSLHLRLRFDRMDKEISVYAAKTG